MADRVLDNISHRRYNALRGSWVLVSPHRTKRPWQGQQEEPIKSQLPDYDPKCYLCPRNKRAQGDENPDYKHTFAFVNDYSAVKETQADYVQTEVGDDSALSLLQVEPVTGKCYVLTFSAKHNATLPDMTPSEILPVIEMWTRIYASHVSAKSRLATRATELLQTLRQPEEVFPQPSSHQLRYMQIFENKGAAMGCSNPHPHCQIWTTSTLPEELTLEIATQSRYRKDHDGRHLLADYVELEIARQERVVWQNEGFLVVCPWWAVWPFEVLVVAKKQARSLLDFGEQERKDLAQTIQEVTRRYDNLFESSFPYSSGLHQAPLEGTEDEIESSYFHMHFYPPLLRSATVKKFLVGYELMAEPQRDITPEQAAARLRACGGELYRNFIQ